MAQNDRYMPLKYRESNLKAQINVELSRYFDDTGRSVCAELRDAEHACSTWQGAGLISLTDVSLNQSVNGRHSSQGEAAIVCQLTTRSKKEEDSCGPTIKVNDDLVKNHDRITDVDVIVCSDYSTFCVPRREDFSLRSSVSALHIDSPSDVIKS